MSAYRITCGDCGLMVHGWSKAEAIPRFRAHVRAEHPCTCTGAIAGISDGPSVVVREQSCSRGPCCHPGRQWGGDEKCRRPNCTCHRRPS